jgi:glycosyltransferase involved in cell wall biosynthesis
VQDFDLLVAGTGQQEASLREQAASNPRVRFLGARPQRELGALYVHATAGGGAALTDEAGGIVVRGGGAGETAVSVRDLGALPEVVEESGGGFVSRTDQELLRAIESLGGSPARRSELGEKGYCAFVRLWSREAHLAQYFGLLREIALKKTGRVPWEA